MSSHDPGALTGDLPPAPGQQDPEATEPEQHDDLEPVPPDDEDPDDSDDPER